MELADEHVILLHRLGHRSLHVSTDFVDADVAAELVELGLAELWIDRGLLGLTDLGAAKLRSLDRFAPDVGAGQQLYSGCA